MEMIEINKENLDTLLEVYRFVERYVEIYKDDEPIEKGIETDAQHFSKILPNIKKILDSQPKIIKENKTLKLNEGEIIIHKNELYTKLKYAKESVNPNYKYCVVDAEINECYLTQDLFTAMKKAKALSLLKDDFCYILEIRKVKDGTYRTFKIGAYNNDYYKDYGYGEMFLHFNYIAERVLTPIILK